MSKIELTGLMPFNDHIEVDVFGSAEYSPAELDYESGTGAQAGWDAYVNAISLSIGSKALIVDKNGSNIVFFNKLEELIQAYLDENGY
jgi:hypothetical protein